MQFRENESFLLNNWDCPIMPNPVTKTNPKGAGRPRLGKKRYEITLYPITAEFLRWLGDGNLSEGIERASHLAQPTANMIRSNALIGRRNNHGR